MNLKEKINKYRSEFDGFVKIYMAVTTNKRIDNKGDKQ